MGIFKHWPYRSGWATVYIPLTFTTCIIGSCNGTCHMVQPSHICRSPSDASMIRPIIAHHRSRSNHLDGIWGYYRPPDSSLTNCPSKSATLGGSKVIPAWLDLLSPTIDHDLTTWTAFGAIIAHQTLLWPMSRQNQPLWAVPKWFQHDSTYYRPPSITI